ncbi:MAG: DUF1697 domain-containing protein [Bryobacteraceae bacterium]|jgi:uncharacterized protein (DUF1697 family)
MIATPHMALLRGVNVGGKNKLPMKDLGVMFTDAGCHNVTTYVQSGNVIFSAVATLAAELPALIATQIGKRFGFQTQIVLRTGEQMRDIVSNNPFIKAGKTEAMLHVLFLADLPDSRNIEHLDPSRSPPDEFIVRGREVYLCLPQGVGRTKLINAYFDSKLRTTSTGRNWRTVIKLSELTQANRH